MIPKKIHYCWFGRGPLSDKDKKCIESWKKFCPDYEIIEWNEDNYDLNRNEYMRAAYREKKLGFVPDYARFDIVYREGGFYLDTDVELIKSLDELRTNHGYMGFEGKIWINGGIGFGAEAGNKTIKALRDMYKSISFYNNDGSLNLRPSPYYITEFLTTMGLVRNDSFQNVGELKIYPTEYFAAKNFETGIVNITEKTISIHQYHASWQTNKKRRAQKLRRIIGVKNFNTLVKLKNILMRKWK